MREKTLSPKRKWTEPSTSPNRTVWGPYHSWKREGGCGMVLKWQAENGGTGTESIVAPGYTDRVGHRYFLEHSTLKQIYRNNWQDLDLKQTLAMTYIEPENLLEYKAHHITDSLGHWRAWTVVEAKRNPGEQITWQTISPEPQTQGREKISWDSTLWQLVGCCPYWC